MDNEYGRVDSDWMLLDSRILDNDIVEFSVKNSITDDVLTLEAGRQGWEWAPGEMLNLSDWGL